MQCTRNRNVLQVRLALENGDGSSETACQNSLSVGVGRDGESQRWVQAE